MWPLLQSMFAMSEWVNKITIALHSIDLNSNDFMQFESQLNTEIREQNEVSNNIIIEEHNRKTFNRWKGESSQ